MTVHNDNAPPAVVRSRPMGVIGLPEDRIEDDTVNETGGDTATGRREVVAAEYGHGPRGAPPASYAAWVAVGAVICGAAGALTGWSRSRRQADVRHGHSASVPSHAPDVTPPHGDPLLPASKRP